MTESPRASHRETSAPQPRPNLLLFFMDELAFDAVGYENPAVQTPNIDRLAKAGIIFNAAHVASMPCIPSRACMISGVHHHRWERISDNPFEGFLKEGNWTWPHALRAAGYRTAIIGALHALPLRARHGFEVMQLCDWGTRAQIESGDPRNRDDYFEWMKAQGLDERLQPDGQPAPSNGVMDGWHWPHHADQHPISWVRDRAVEYITEKQHAGENYMAYVSFRAPHSPYIPAEPYASMYDPDSIPVPAEGWTDMEGYVPSLDFDPKKGFNGISARPDAKAFQILMAKYYGMITQVDAAIGRILEQVDLEETMVILATDHGDFCGKRGRILKIPIVPFESISRIPFLISGAGVPCGQTCRNPTSLLDIAPTFLQAAGIEIPNALDGIPLQDYFSNADAHADRVIYTFGDHGLDAVQQGAIKYFRSHNRADEMLFDLQSDPEEKLNLAQHPGYSEQKDFLSRAMDRVLELPKSNLPRFDISTD